MAQLPSFDHQEVIRRLWSELLDAYDEELEMEIEDHHPLREHHEHYTRQAVPADMIVPEIY
jgi:hypothetical protein